MKLRTSIIMAACAAALAAAPHAAKPASLAALQAEGLRVTCTNPDRGDVTEDVTAEVDGPDVRIGAAPGSRVEVRYTGRLAKTGKVFDATKNSTVSGFTGSGGSTTVASGFTLAAGSTCNLNFEVRVNPTRPLPALQPSGGRYNNQATVSGVGALSGQTQATNAQLTDLSDNGTNSDANGNEVIYTNQANATLRYTGRVTDTTKFPPLFVDALGWLLAQGLCLASAEGRDAAEDIHAALAAKG